MRPGRGREARPCTCGATRRSGKTRPRATASSRLRTRLRRRLQRKPLAPSSTVSANPPSALAITGTPRTIASIATRPSGSRWSEGATSAQASASESSTCWGSTQPVNVTAGPSPSSSVSRSRSPRSGPSPTMRRRAEAVASRSRANARSRSGKPFRAQAAAIDEGRCQRRSRRKCSPGAPSGSVAPGLADAFRSQRRADAGAARRTRSTRRFLRAGARNGVGPEATSGRLRSLAAQTQPGRDHKGDPWGGASSSSGNGLVVGDAHTDGVGPNAPRRPATGWCSIMKRCTTSGRNSRRAVRRRAAAKGFTIWSSA